jgi:hypothetical protein
VFRRCTGDADVLFEAFQYLGGFCYLHPHGVAELDAPPACIDSALFHLPGEDFCGGFQLQTLLDGG